MQFGAAAFRHLRHIRAEGIKNQRRHIRPVQQFAEILRRQGSVQGHCHAAAVNDPEIRDQPLIGSAPDDRDMVSLLSQFL